MLKINFLVTTLLLIGALSAEAISIPEEDTNIEDPYTSDSFYDDFKFSQDQDMHFPDPDGGKMSRTAKGATWQGKRGNFDISVSVDDIDPHFEFKTEWGKNQSKDEPKKKRKD